MNIPNNMTNKFFFFFSVNDKKCLSVIRTSTNIHYHSWCVLLLAQKVLQVLPSWMFAAKEREGLYLSGKQIHDCGSMRSTCFGSSFVGYETHFFFSCRPVCCTVDIARGLFLMTAWAARPYSCPMDQMLSECTRQDYFIWKHTGKTSLSCIFQTRSLSLSLSENDSLFQFPCIILPTQLLGNCMAEQGCFASWTKPGIVQGAGTPVWTSPVEENGVTLSLSPPKAKCSNCFFDSGFVQQHLLKDVNLQPLLALSHVKTEAEQKSQSRAPVGCMEKMGMKLVCKF